MAKTITVPGGAKGQRIAEAFAGQYGWQKEVADPDGDGTIPNPESKEDFAARKISEYITEVVASYEGNAAGDAARAAAVEKAKKDVVL